MAHEDASELTPLRGGDTEPSDPKAVRKRLRRRETVTGNPLSIDVIYAQRLTLLQPSKEEEFQRRIKKYADDMLNNEQFGVVFYKAREYSAIEE